MKTSFRLCSLLLLALAVPACKKDRSCENCPPDNQPPVARAGTDRVVKLPVDTTTLDGSASSDPDGKVVAYEWRQVDGPAGSRVVRADAAVTSVHSLAQGRYAFELKVTDDKGLSGQDTVVVDVQVETGINHPPVARAGDDQSITLPANSVRLDGSRSSDPENNIIAYAWTKISGPSFQMGDATAVQTSIAHLVEGAYLFALTVTDAGELTDSDTVQVTVYAAATVSACDQSHRPNIPVRLVAAGTLSQPRWGMAVAAAGDKILFAGGNTNRGRSFSSRVDIYDRSTQKVTTSELSEARYSVAAVAAGNKVFFAGGETGDGTAQVWTIDIYDVATNAWSNALLSVPGSDIAAAAAGGKVLFAGGSGGASGLRHRTVDIYDLATDSWSTASLNEAKESGVTAVAALDKVYLAGGTSWPPNLQLGTWFATRRIDVYDPATNTWSTDNMVEGKYAHAAVAAGSKIFWAGGFTGAYANASIDTSCVVEIKDVVTGQSTVQQLSAPAVWIQNNGRYSVVQDNKVIFYRSGGGDQGQFDIYDTATNRWSVGVLPTPIVEASIIAVSGTVYLAGGWMNGALSDKIWKVEF